MNAHDQRETTQIKLYKFRCQTEQLILVSLKNLHSVLEGRTEILVRHLF